MASVFYENYSVIARRMNTVCKSVWSGISEVYVYERRCI